MPVLAPARPHRLLGGPTHLQNGVHPGLQPVLGPAQQRLAALQHVDSQGVTVDQLQRGEAEGTRQDAEPG